jgi:hypothetical protein
MKPRIQFRAAVPSDYKDFTEATSYYPGPQFGGIVAWCWDGQKNIIMGMVGMDGWTPNAVTMHWYIRHPRCLLPLWREVCKYLAMHGKKKIVGTTPSNNTRALRTMYDKLGWRKVATIEGGWADGVDIIISEYLLDEQLAQVA